MDNDRIIQAYHEELALLKSTLPADPPSPVYPPLPDNCDPALADMLKSWYEAGYQTGRFQALREVGRHDET